MKHDWRCPTTISLLAPPCVASVPCNDQHRSIGLTCAAMRPSPHPARNFITLQPIFKTYLLFRQPSHFQPSLVLSPYRTNMLPSKIGGGKGGGIRSQAHTQPSETLPQNLRANNCPRFRLRSPLVWDTTFQIHRAKMLPLQPRRHPTQPGIRHRWAAAAIQSNLSHSVGMDQNRRVSRGGSANPSCQRESKHVARTHFTEQKVGCGRASWSSRRRRADALSPTHA